MEIKDLVGLSKPLTRLIEVTSAGMGRVSEPSLIRAVARAKADEIKIISGALKEAGLPVVYTGGEIQMWQKPEDNTLVSGPNSIEERAATRVEYQERKRQHNIEYVTSTAAVELAREEDVPDEMPDEDWIARFFNSAQDVSSEQMQEVWGRILAGEIKKPGTYSLKTLDAVRNLSKKDASLIEKISQYAISIAQISCIPTPDHTWLEDKMEMIQGDMFEMSELGLVYPGELYLTVFAKDSSYEERIIEYGDHILLVRRGEIKGEIGFKAWKFTGIGREILSLVSSTYDEEFIIHLGEHFAQIKGEATLGKITERLSDGRISYNMIREFKLGDPNLKTSETPPL